MLIKMAKASDCKEFEVTDKQDYLNRRQFIRGAVMAGAAIPATSVLSATEDSLKSDLIIPSDLKQPFLNIEKTHWGKDETISPYRVATSYNNFYEFGYGKSDPEKHASSLKTEPWTITVEGEAEKTGKFDLDSMIKSSALEERIYRLRCVEAWSMVIPWVGIPLKDILTQFQPTSKAKYVYFETLYRPEQMSGQRGGVAIDWPYREGLRIDEAMHPLALLGVGMYGSILANQNGAPVRLIVPWKYGFKSIKSIVKIHFVENMPQTTWSSIAPNEYGFYANVNPNVDHPRWSQAQERRLPGGLFLPNVIATKMFNGYDEVASLYSGMDLKRYY